MISVDCITYLLKHVCFKLLSNKSMLCYFSTTYAESNYSRSWGLLTSCHSSSLYIFVGNLLPTLQSKGNSFNLKLVLKCYLILN